MKKHLLLSVVACLVLLIAGCGGPSKDDVKAAIKDAVQQNMLLGMVNHAVNIEDVTVDTIEKKEDGIYEAMVTIRSQANVAGVKLGGTVQTPLRLKKINDKWVIQH